MPKINKKSLATIMAATISLVGGCSNQQNIAGGALSETEVSDVKLSYQDCQIPTGAFNNLPTEVLDATDITSIDNFTLAELKGESFDAEIGGARITIELQAGAGLYNLTRTYKEPGVEDSKKSYTILCKINGRFYGNHIRGLATENGILWLELNSEHDFIPPQLWIHLNQN